ncbi:MAG TPA: heme-binding protein [Burkholderiales bacterium]|nr:heme-binding protein [Burkholderiales bacterium]
MLRLSSFAAFMFATSAAFAQVPADPANPNENLPEKANFMPYGEPIKLEQAKKAADAALAESTKRGWPVMCIAVVSPSGDLVYFVKMDECQYASIAIAQHKAKAAATFRRPTLAFERLLGRGPFFSYLTTLDGVIASRGGNPIVANGKIIGAIGVSGGTGSQDEVVSQAGVATSK